MLDLIFFDENSFFQKLENLGEKQAAILATSVLFYCVLFESSLSEHTTQELALKAGEEITKPITQGLSLVDLICLNNREDLLQSMPKDALLVSKQSAPAFFRVTDAWLLQRLLQEGFSPDLKDQFGRNLLAFKIAENNLKAANQVVNETNEVLTMSDKLCGLDVFQHAVSAEGVDFLLETFGDTCFDAQEKMGPALNNYLHTAVLNMQRSKIQHLPGLLKKFVFLGVDRCEENQDGFAPLHLLMHAQFMKNPAGESVAQVLSEPTLVNRLFPGQTYRVLTYALLHSQWRIAKGLLEDPATECFYQEEFEDVTFEPASFLVLLYTSNKWRISASQDDLSVVFELISTILSKVTRTGQVQKITKEMIDRLHAETVKSQTSKLLV